MSTMKIVAAAAIATGLLASPALAKDKMKRTNASQDYRTQQMVDNGYRGDGYGYRRDMRQRDSGFWPGDVAAGAVGGAIGSAGAAVNTAGAIATAPFRSSWNDSYASSNGWNNGWDSGYGSRQTYAQRNGFVCEPGTLIRDQTGQRQICQ